MRLQWLIFRVVAFMFIFCNTIGCDRPIVGGYAYWNWPPRHLASVKKLFASFVEYTALKAQTELDIQWETRRGLSSSQRTISVNDDKIIREEIIRRSLYNLKNEVNIPASPKEVFDYFPNRMFFSYLDTQGPAADLNITNKPLKFIQLSEEVSYSNGDLLYYRAWIKDQENPKQYIGFTIICLGSPELLPKTNPEIKITDWIPIYNIDAVHWGEFIKWPDQSAIPLNIMTPDGEPDDILIRLDYLVNMPYDRLDDIYWERS